MEVAPKYPMRGFMSAGSGHEIESFELESSWKAAYGGQHLRDRTGGVNRKKGESWDEKRLEIKLSLLRIVRR